MATFWFFSKPNHAELQMGQKIGWGKLKVGSWAQLLPVHFFNSREAQGLCSW